MDDFFVFVVDQSEESAETKDILGVSTQVGQPVDNAIGDSRLPKGGQDEAHDASLAGAAPVPTAAGAEGQQYAACKGSIVVAAVDPNEYEALITSEAGQTGTSGDTIEFKYTMFLDQGTPVRATADVQNQVAKDAFLVDWNWDGIPAGKAPESDVISVMQVPEPEPDFTSTANASSFEDMLFA